ncbi:signal recognition particle-docking protein FtsY [Oxyplasma meridianum]|uniref:Signal recognition particle receptor FtsY n=1 Tax=Oxyplasma meridianum TaxID=3073602 RepID=A0AAX4NHT2_9ARCH
MFEGIKNKFIKLFKSSTSGTEIIRRDEVENTIRNILLEADVDYDTAQIITERLDRRIIKSGRKIEMDLVKEYLKETITEILNEIPPALDILNAPKKPYVILFLGINGTGKTTTISKIASYLRKNGKRVVLAAADTFRAGAIEQISALGSDIGVNVIKHTAGSDPSSVAFDAIEHAKARDIDYVLVDSAGRMQTNKNLIDEMRKIKRVAKPDLTVMVLDSMIGQDAYNQAEVFMNEIKFDAVILTKLDTDARGGAVLTIVHQLKKPVLFLGTGQGFDDLIKFDPKWYIGKIIP